MIYEFTFNNSKTRFRCVETINHMIPQVIDHFEIIKMINDEFISCEAPSNKLRGIYTLKIDMNENNKIVGIFFEHDDYDIYKPFEYDFKFRTREERDISRRMLEANPHLPIEKMESIKDEENNLYILRTYWRDEEKEVRK